MEKTPTISDYFNDFMLEVRTHYVYPDKVNDETLQKALNDISEDDPDKAQKVRQAAQKFLRDLDSHSSFIKLPPPSEKINKPDFKSEMIDDIAYISLPPCDFALDATPQKEYAREGIKLVAALLKQKPIGAIIDLRENNGGDCHPMVAVIAPFLNRKTHVRRLDADGVKRRGVTFDYKKGYVRNGGHPYKFLTRVTAKPNKSLPIAVIHNEKTNSSGELIALTMKGNPLAKSFGKATYGHTSYNVVIPAPHPEVFGKEQFALTTSIMVDRRGKIYGTPINPDVETNYPLEDAKIWIRQQAKPS